MAHRVCPWWLGYFLVSPLRRFGQDPRRILGPFVQPGMTVLEPGCGMGFFTLELARLVGSSGKVVVVDIQQKMLDGLRRRAARAGVADRIDARLADPGSLGVDDLAATVDFALAFAMVHELPDQNPFFSEVCRALKAGGRLLLAEPRGHVTADHFAATLVAAEHAGLNIDSHPPVRSSHTALLRRVRA